MVLVEHKSSGVRERVTPEEAAVLIQRNEVLVEEGATVPVATPEGYASNMPIEDYAKWASVVAPVSQQYVDEAEKRMDINTLGGQAEAAAWGAAEGLTLGGSTWAASELGGDETREHLRLLKEVNPGSSMAGTVAGALVPALLTKGGSMGVTAGRLGLLGRAAALTPAGLATRGGYIASRGVQGLMGSTAATMGGRVLQGALPYAAMGAVEGAAFGAGQRLSEDTLGNHEITAQRLLMGAGEGALVGGALGGILGGVAGAGGHVLGKAGPSMERMAAADAGQLLGGRSLGQKIVDSANTQNLKGLGVNMSGFDDLTDIGRRAVNEATAGSGRWTISGMRAAAEDAVASARKVVNELDDLALKTKQAASTVDVAAGAIKPRLAAPEQAAKSALKERIEAIADETVRYNPVYAKDAEEMLGFLKTVDAAQSPAELRRAADSITMEAGKKKLGKSEGLNQFWTRVRDAVDDEAAAQFDRIAMEIAPDKVGTYRNALEVSRGMDWLDRALKGKPDGFLDQAMAAAEGVATGQQTITSAITGAAMRQVTPVKTAAWRAIGRVLDPQTATVNAMGKVAAGADAKVKAAGAGFVKFLKDGKPLGRTLPKAYLAASQPESMKDLRAEAVKIVARAKAAQANPSAAMDAVSKDAGALAMYAPKTFASLAQKYQAGHEAILAMMPPSRRKHFLAHLDQPPMDDVTAGRIVRANAALRNPMGVVERLPSGNVTREEIEMVKVMAPDVFAQMQNNIMMELATQQIDPDYRGRLTLSMVFGIPADGSMMPASVAMSQSVFKTEGVDSGVDGRSAQGPRNTPPKRAIEGYSSAMRTREQRREERDPGGSI